MKRTQILMKAWQDVSTNSRKVERKTLTAAEVVARFAAQCGLDKKLRSNAYWQEFIDDGKSLSTGSQRLAVIRKQAKKLAQEGDHRTAVGVLFHALALELWNAASYSEIAEMYHAMGEHSKALKAYKRALELKLDDVQCQHRLGMAYLLCDDSRPAATAFARAVKLKPDFSEPYDQLALIYRKCGYHDSAIEVLTRRIEICGDDTGLAYGALACSLMYRNRYEEAAAAYRQAADLARDNADWRYEEGEALTKAGRYEEAVSAYRQALEIAPNNMNPVISIACAYDHMGDPEQGDRVIERMSIIIGEDGGSLENLANEIRSKSDLYEFIDTLLDDLKENPNGWSNFSLPAFLDALRGSLARGYDDYYGVRNLPEFDWRALGQVLLAARSYE